MLRKKYKCKKFSRNRHKKAQQPDKKEENFFTRIGNSFSSGIEHIKNFFSNSSDEKNNNSVLDYLERSAKQVIMGNYTDEVTAWGTGMQLCLGLTGADIVMDIRDIVYDFHKWEWSFEHVGQTGFDVLSVAPLIGALKYSDEVVDLVKGVDKTSDVVKNVDRTTDVIKGASEAKSYYRVQGGEMPNASQVRIKVDANGNMSIPNKNANLNVSIGTKEHAEYFLQKRGNGAEIVEVEVPQWFDDFVQENAIPQYKYNSNPLNQGGTAPKIVDPSTPGTSYEFPAPWIEWIEEYGKIK